MSEKRRGLGRGLGALIPSSPVVPAKPGERPVDVFFADRGDGEPAAAPAEGEAAELAPPTTGEELTAPVGAVTPEADTRHSHDSGDVAELGSPQGSPQAWGDEIAPRPSSFSVDSGIPTGRDDETADLEAALAVEWATESRTGGFGVPLSRESSDASTNGATQTTDMPGAPVEVVTAIPTPAPDVPDEDLGGASQSSSTEEVTQTGPDLLPVPGARFAELPVLSIRPNPRQPRTVFDEEALAELVHSIREIGVLQPVVVRPVADGSEYEYELIMGERRWRATQEAGLETIPAIIRDTEDDALLRDALLENLHRSDLNALEEAAAYQQLLDDFGCTHEELATRIGRSRPQISNTIRLLRLPPAVQRRVAAGVLSAGHARALLGLENAEAMDHLAQRIVAEGLSVRATEESVSLSDSAPAPTSRRRPRAGGQHAELDDLAARLGDRLDTKVHVALGSSKGRLTIDFASVEDLNRILDILVPQERGVFKAPA